MIKQWITDFSESDRKTKWFIINGLVYGIALIVTMVYCYARLDFVRSYEALPPDSKVLNSDHNAPDGNKT